VDIYSKPATICCKRLLLDGKQLDSETVYKLGVEPESVGGNFKGAGKEVKEGGQEAGQEIQEGVSVAAG
jgi:hypothetical protein